MEEEKKRESALRILGMAVTAFALVMLLQQAPTITLGVEQPYRIQETAPEPVMDFVLNRNSRIFHLPECRYANQINEKNRMNFTGTYSEACSKGYSPCDWCRPKDANH